MPVHMVIRQKRKEAGLTQEQVAKYLGVSAPAVNKWEKGATYPDITLLPPLARLLKVDLNTLLCFEEGPSEKEICSILDRLTQTIEKEGLDAGFKMAVEKVREYPASGALHHRTAQCLEWALLMSGMTAEEKKPYEDRIIYLYERGEESQDKEIQKGARFMLVSKFMLRGDYGKAQEILDLLPERGELDKRKLQADLFLKQNRLGEAAVLLERDLMTRMGEIQMILLSLAQISLKEGRKEDAAEIGEISRKSQLLFERGAYSSYVGPLEAAAAGKDIPKTIAVLKSLLAAALTPWDMEDTILYRHFAAEKNRKIQQAGKNHQARLPDKKEYAALAAAKILPPLLAELENNPKYAFLYEEPEFQNLLKKYRGRCQEINKKD